MRRTVIALGLAAVAALSLFLSAPTLDYAFVYDDHANILERDAAWDEGWGTFLSTGHWGVGRHVALLSYDLDRRDPLDPRPFHRTNALLAAIASMLVVLVATGIGIGPIGAVASGLLFAAHPVHADAVAALAGRADLLAAVCVLAAVALHVRGYPGGPLVQAASAPLLFLGMASKESAIALLPILIAYDVLLGSTEHRRLVRPAYAGYVVALVAWLALTAGNFADVSPIVFVDNPLAHDRWYVRVARASYVLAEYLRVVLLPGDQRLDYSYAVLDPTPAMGVAALCTWAVAASISVLLARSRPRLVFCVAWFPLAFVATANVAFPIGTIMAERLAYLPSVGPCLLAGLAASTAVASGRAAAIAAAALVLGVLPPLGVELRERAAAWSDDTAYHERAALESPRSAKAHYNLGLVYAASGAYDRAVESLQRAREIRPSFARAAYHLARVHEANGDLGRAAEVYRDYLREAPEDQGALAQLVALELRRGNPAGALAPARRLVALEPDDPRHRVTLAWVERALASSASP